jgi:hypothetical protein
MKRKLDVITSKDLPGLRADLCAYVENDSFSPEFRAVCRETVAAIDVAVAEDRATNTRLQHALERFVSAGNAARQLC